MTKKKVVKVAMATDDDIAVLDVVPVLQRFVEQHLYSIPAQTPDEQTYVLDVHPVVTQE